MTDWANTAPDEVLEFWFPDDGHHLTMDTHGAFWMWRMGGKAHQDIIDKFSELTEAAAKGSLDHWAETPRGRLALVIVLDQFSRSVFADTPAAFSQDIKACRLVLDAFGNGHFDALKHVWERNFCLIAVGHCEGPDHLDRMETVVSRGEQLITDAPAHLKPAYEMSLGQAHRARETIRRFGRHAHRNPVLGRISTPAEEAYLAEGVFPHNTPPKMVP